MNMTQKGAWFGVYLSSLLLAIAVVDLTGILDYKGFPTPWMLVLHTFLAVVFFLLPIIWLNRSRKKSEIVLDERDRSIIKRSLIAAFISVFSLLCIFYVAVLFVSGLKKSITIISLPDIVYGVFIILILTLSIAVLVQYGRGIKGEKS
jgi:Ca2+/Na+ antiporter